MLRIEFFLYPDAVSLDVVGPLDVFSCANIMLDRQHQGDKGYQAGFSADETGLVPMNSGLKLYAEKAVGNSDPVDIFLVPGGMDVKQVTANKPLISRIRSQALQADCIVSVCGGAFILAECGLIKGRDATTHWDAADELAALYPDVHVNADAIYIRDGRVFTSAGVTAGIDLALAMVEEHHGPELAMDVARQLVVYYRRPGNQSQFSAPMELRARAGEKFRKLHDWILKHIRLPLTVDVLADRVAMSPRNFSRSFSKTTGIPPGQYVEKIRFETARQLLENSDMGVDEVAHACGLIRQDRLRRLFLKYLGISPSQYRRHFQRNIQG